MSEGYKKLEPFLPATFSTAEKMEWIKRNTYLEPVGVIRNREMLEHIPHMRMGDIAAICRIRIETKDGASIACPVTDSFIRRYDIPGNILDIALANTIEARKTVFRTMGEMIEEIEGTHMEPERTPALYVLSNTEAYFGAAAVFYPGILEGLYQRFPEGYYVLPSSVHEVLIVPKNMQPDVPNPAGELSAMVKEINAAMVSPLEQLSDMAHEYAAGERTLVIAEDSPERQKDLEKKGRTRLSGH